MPKTRMHNVINVDPRDIAACDRKNSHSTKQRAKLAAIHLAKQIGVKVYSYECRVCGAFHITKIDPEQERARRRNRGEPTP